MKIINKQKTRIFKTALLTLLVVLSSAFTTISAQNDPVRLGFIPLNGLFTNCYGKRTGLIQKIWS